MVADNDTEEPMTATETATAPPPAARARIGEVLERVRRGERS